MVSVLATSSAALLLHRQMPTACGCLPALQICMQGDVACRRENRLKAGFLPIHDPGFF